MELVFLVGGFLLAFLLGMMIIPKILLISYKKRLFDMPRSGRTASYTKQDEQRVIDQISQEPPDGLSRWDGTTLARE